MKNHFSVKTILRTDKPSVNEKFPLNYLIIFNSQNLKFSAKLYCTKSDWDSVNNCPKGVSNSLLKKKLKQEELKIHEILLGIDISGKPMTKELIKELYRGNGTKKDFYYYFDKFCENKFLSIRKGTQYHYQLFRKQLKEYKKEICLEEIDVKFIEGFLNYLKENKGIGNSGLATRRKHFSAVLNRFVIDKLIDNNPCKHIPKPKESSKTIFLTAKEIEAIRTADLSLGNLTNGLELTRKLFLFSCYTGLRYSDVMNLKKENIQETTVPSSNKEMIYNRKIVVEMIKTKSIVEIPLHPRAFKILVKCGLTFKKPDELIFERRENVSVNRDLKKIALLAGIKKQLTFHVSRHTFGSQLATSGTQPFYIMKLMGHKDVRMTEAYVNSDEEILSGVMNSINF